MLAQRAAAAPVTIVEFSDPDDDDAGANSRPTPSKGRIPLTAVRLAHSVAPNLTPVYQANKAQLRGERKRRFEPGDPDPGAARLPAGRQCKLTSRAGSVSECTSAFFINGRLMRGPSRLRAS